MFDEWTRSLEKYHRADETLEESIETKKDGKLFHLKLNWVCNAFCLIMENNSWAT